MSDSANAKRPLPGLPDDVLQVINSAIFTEFATMTKEGVPLDTPTYCFTGSEGRSLDIATGLAYPAKAERARRNSKVGLLLEGPPGTPVVSIAAIAAVRDADIQANASRYIAETIAYESVRAQDSPWSARRSAVWYWARIFVLCAPKRILWWPSAADTDSAPQCWTAPPDSDFPISDLAPAAAQTAPPDWPKREWHERAKEILAIGIAGHITLVDDEGFPLPLRCRSTALVSDGFELDIPAGAPWKVRGKASLCFAGLATFIGEVLPLGRSVHFTVERILPTLPTVLDPKEVFTPSPATRAALMGRLERELARRGQAIPEIFLEPPPPTPGSLVRARMMARMVEEMSLRSKTSD